MRCGCHEATPHDFTLDLVLAHTVTLIEDADLISASALCTAKRSASAWRSNGGTGAWLNLFIHTSPRRTGLQRRARGFGTLVWGYNASWR